MLFLLWCLLLRLRLSRRSDTWQKSVGLEEGRALGRRNEGIARGDVQKVAVAKVLNIFHLGACSLEDPPGPRSQLQLVGAVVK